MLGRKSLLQNRFGKEEATAFYTETFPARGGAVESPVFILIFVLLSTKKKWRHDSQIVRGRQMKILFCLAKKKKIMFSR